MVVNGTDAGTDGFGVVLRRILYGCGAGLSFFNAWVAFVSNSDRYWGNTPEYVGSLRKQTPINLFQYFAAAAGYRTFCPPGQFTRYFVAGFAVLGGVCVFFMFRRRGTRQVSTVVTAPPVEVSVQEPVMMTPFLPPAEVMAPSPTTVAEHTSQLGLSDVVRPQLPVEPSGEVTLQEFGAEFVEMTNSCDGLTATREALQRSFECARAGDRVRAVLWIDFIYVTYEQMLESYLPLRDFEYLAQLSMWHGIVRSLGRKSDVVQPFVQAFEFARGGNDPLIVARSTEEYAWALDSTNMSHVTGSQLNLAEEMFRTCGRPDRADEIVRLRNGGQRLPSSFLRRSAQSPQATSVLGSSDAAWLRTFF